MSLAPTQAFDSEESEDESDPHYTEINKLEGMKVSIYGNECKINANDIKKLKENSNLFTVESIAFTPISKITEIKGISESKAEKLKQAAKGLLSSKMSFVTAENLYDKRQKVIKKITTGSDKLDKLLGGGIETGSITEFYGESGCGKTQICHQLSITAQFPTESGGAEGCVLCIDTCGTFRPKRVARISERYGVDKQDLLDNISFARAYTTEHQMELLKEVHKMMTESHYALVIVDSGTGLFRTEYITRGCRFKRDEALREFCAELRKLCDIYGVAVVITNQIESCPQVAKLNVDKYNAWGDEILPHCVTTRIELRKGSKFKWYSKVAKIIKSPNLPQGECVFGINDDGVIDE